MHSHIVADPAGAAQSDQATIPPSESGGRWLATNKSRQCPICDRTRDGDCRINTDGRINCHHHKTLTPSKETYLGSDGIEYAFLGNGERGGLFKPHQAGTKRHLRAVSSGVTAKPVPAVQTLPLPNPASFFLARYSPAVVAVASRHEGEFYYYDDEHRQQRRGSGPKKQIYTHHLVGGQWKPGANGTCPSWNEKCLPVLEGFPLFAEGEKTAEIACQLGLVGMSLPGHQAESLEHCTTAFKRHRQLGLTAVAYLADVGEAGKKKGEIVKTAAKAAGLPAIIINAGDVWPDLPDNGSLDDLHQGDDANEIIAAIDAAIRNELAALLPIATSAVTAASSAKPVKAKYLEPGEVLDALAATIGNPRLNVRTNGAVIEGEHVGPDQISRYYLRLSKRTAADGIKWKKTETIDGVVDLADENRFDPVLDSLLALTAGVEPLPDRLWLALDELLLGTKNKVAAEFLPMYLVSAVARLMNPGCKVDQSLVLIGPQGVGKSRWGQATFGIDSLSLSMASAYVVDHLGSRLDKDDVTRMHRAWAVELGELDGIVRRTDQESFKAFLTRQTDVIRRPYKAGDEEMPRRNVFFGTSNGAPLKDLTGSRRFVCVGLSDQPLPLDRVMQYRAALWAKALEEYQAGAQWWSTNNEATEIAAQNCDFQTLEPWAEVIGKYLQERGGAVFVTLQEILDHLELPITARNSGTGSRITQMVEALGWTKQRKLIGGVQLRAFFNPKDPDF